MKAILFGATAMSRAFCASAPHPPPSFRGSPQG